MTEQTDFIRDQELLTVTQAAAEFKVPPGALRRAAKRGQLHSVQVGAHARYRREQIRAWVKSHPSRLRKYPAGWLPLAMVAGELGVSDRTLAKACQRGEIPAWRQNGAGKGRWLISSEDLGYFRARGYWPKTKTPPGTDPEPEEGHPWNDDTVELAPDPCHFTAVEVRRAFMAGYWCAMRDLREVVLGPLPGIALEGRFWARETGSRLSKELGVLVLPRKLTTLKQGLPAALQGEGE